MKQNGFFWGELLGDLVNQRNYWLGATDKDQEGVWRWVTDESWSYTAWRDAGEPNNGGGQTPQPQNYLITVAGNRWDDRMNVEGNSYYYAGAPDYYVLEFGYPTDPTKADTDGDGFLDKEETELGSDPNNNDVYPGRIRNGSFENGFTGWNAQNASLSVIGSVYGLSPYEGNWQFTLNGGDMSPVDWVEQLVPLKREDSYKLSFSVGKLGPYSGTIRVRVKIYNPAGTILQEQIYSASTATTYLRNQMILNLNTSPVWIRFEDASLNTSGIDLALDYVTLEKISPGTAPVITSTNSFLGQVGVAFSNTVTASGTTPITFGATNLPTALNIATNGLISGTPTTAGTNTATLTASNAFGTTNQTATFVITKGTPVISSWPIASAITYGQTLSNSVLSGGSVNPTGNFTWTVPTNQPNAGTNSQSVTFTPSATNNYNLVTNTVSLVVNKASPLLIWTPSPTVGLTYPAPLSSTQLNATSSVPGTFIYNPASGAVFERWYEYLGCNLHANRHSELYKRADDHQHGGSREGDSKHHLWSSADQVCGGCTV